MTPSRPAGALPRGGIDRTTGRSTWTTGVVGAVVVVGALLAGCANQRGLDLARQACQHVDRSLALYRASTSGSSSGVGGAQRTEALAQLRLALPLAATAAGEASQWQGLMATLAESSHVPESDLVRALRQQCDSAESNGIPGAAPSTSTSTPLPGSPGTSSTGP